MTVSELLEKMPASELIEWQAYYELEPFGEFMDDYRAGMITAMVANTTRRKSTDRVFKPTDFIPGYAEKSPEEPQETLGAKVEMLRTIYGSRRLGDGIS